MFDFDLKTVSPFSIWHLPFEDLSDWNRTILWNDEILPRHCIGPLLFVAFGLFKGLCPSLAFLIFMPWQTWRFYCKLVVEGRSLLMMFISEFSSDTNFGSASLAIIIYMTINYITEIDCFTIWGWDRLIIRFKFILQ